ncbi:MAG: hypothetical protein ACFE0P_04660 [Oceanicaulis sp.]
MARTDWIPVSIWMLGAGYFAAYILFAGALRLSGAPEAGAFALFPGFLTGLAVGAAPCLYLMARRARRLAPQIPALGLDWRTAVSGVATAVIIVTTVFALSFNDVTVLAALVMMRGGVLALGPAIDLANRRAIRPAAWIAFALSLAAAGLALSGSPSLAMPALVAINLAVYVLAYLVRLSLMTHGAKRPEPGERARWFVREISAAVIVLLLALGLGMLAPGWGRAVAEGFLNPATLAAGIVVGLGYAAVLTFGTLIYLDQRENTFAVPVNRGASLISGVVLSLALHWIAGHAAPSPVVFAGAALVAAALLVLARFDNQARLAASASRR